jgi:polyphenol oxidase
MNRHQVGPFAYYTFESLDAFPEVVHGVTTRHGGVSAGPWASLNLTKGTGDDPAAVEENLRRTSEAFGFKREDLVSPGQKHTANTQRVGAKDRGQIFACTDTLVTAEAGVPLLLRFADCTPVLLYDPRRGAIAVVHSGWRGTMQAAAAVAVGSLAAEFGSEPADIVAAIGPSIGPCCYEVGDEVVAATRAAFDDAEPLLPRGENGRRHFDLWGANERWLRGAGVRQVETARLCTACHRDEFFSYRAQQGTTGHFGAVMALRQTDVEMRLK